MYAMPGPPMTRQQMAAQDEKVVAFIDQLMGPKAPFTCIAGSLTVVGRKA